MSENLTEHRRQLHRIPELDFDLPKTRAYVTAVLAELPCKLINVGKGGLCAYFDAGKPDTLAFRCDMDALPITEENDLDYASTHPGRMHACGHDGHTAIMLGFAEALAKRRGAPPHNALLIFQAAEETTGGAKEIIDSGVLGEYNVSGVFGLHLWPGYEKGAIICRKGAFMAKACVLHVEVFGRSCHAATAEKGLDALWAGARFVTEAYRAEREAFDEGVFRLLKFGVFESGVAMNVISGRATIRGTMRCFEEDVFLSMKDRLRAVAAEIGRESGCRLELKFIEGCPAVRNDPALFERLKHALRGRAAASAGGEDDGGPFVFVEPAAPSMTSEDFSEYQRELPGVFFHLGTGGDTPLHSSVFDVDESTLPFGVKAFWRLLHSL
jgi:hippurate hydrolase